jgi:hypothetical protein
VNSLKMIFLRAIESIANQKALVKINPHAFICR